MPVGSRPVPGVNPEIRPIALSLGYLPETFEKCRERQGAGFCLDFLEENRYIV
jgi:hypothetical protein